MTLMFNLVTVIEMHSTLLFIYQVFVLGEGHVHTVTV